MSERPPSRNSRCPHWCSGVHEQDEFGRVTHRGASVTVPVVERQHPLAPYETMPYGFDMIVGLERRDDETWVWIGPAEDAARAMILSTESTRRLYRALAQVLERGGPTS
jgi:hypothetical protein